LRTPILYKAHNRTQEHSKVDFLFLCKRVNSFNNTNIDLAQNYYQIILFSRNRITDDLSSRSDLKTTSSQAEDWGRPLCPVAPGSYDPESEKLTLNLIFQAMWLA
jgi:hypothetical protein